MKTKRINELNNLLSKEKIMSNKFEVNRFNNMTEKEQKKWIDFLIYTGVSSKELNNLYAVPTGKVYKVKRNTLKTILKRVLLHPFTVALTVYLLVILSIIILTIKI